MSCLFFPQQGNSIHAQVYPPADELFKNRVKEGGVYTFSYFRVRVSNIYYKLVENDQMLVFTKWTKVEEVLAVPPAFQCMPTQLPHKNSFKHVLTAGHSLQVNKVFPVVCIRFTVSMRYIPPYVPCLTHACFSM